MTILQTLCIVVCLVILVIGMAGRWQAYKKAKQPGWASIIPIYNFYIMTKIGGKPGWWVLLLMIPGVNIVFAIWLNNMVSKRFGKDSGFTAGLLLLGFIFWPILGFGDAKYTNGTNAR